MEALLQSSHDPGVPKKLRDEDRDGYAIFRKVCEHVVLFTGSHRFSDEDLPHLLRIMRTKGSAKVPEELRARVRRQIITG
eukprot:5335973-Karenia_brevis.AAC.1